MIFFSIFNQLVLNCQMITSKMQMQFALFQKLSINFNFDWYWCQNNHQISRFELLFFFINSGSWNPVQQNLNSLHWKNFPRKLQRFHASVKMYTWQVFWKKYYKCFCTSAKIFAIVFEAKKLSEKYDDDMTLVMRIINLIRFCFANSLFACLNFYHLVRL